MQNEVLLLGRLSNPYPLLAKSQGLIINSNREGFPTVAIEALTLNVNFISSRCFLDLEMLMDKESYDNLTYEVNKSSNLVRIFEQIASRKYSTKYIKSYEDLCSKGILNAF